MNILKETIGYLVAIMLLTPIVMAFPLDGDNGISKATVFGAVVENGKAYVDIAYSPRPGGPIVADIELVDSDDKTYPGSPNMVSNYDPRNDGYRKIVEFEVPEGTIIKRVRISPQDEKGGDPFSIDWTGVPEVSNDMATMKFYGATKLGEAWSFDVKLTNNGPKTMEYSNSDLRMIDQFGWVYPSSANNPYSEKIVSNESLRFDIQVESVSQFSRPTTLQFKNLSMDISAWA